MTLYEESMQNLRFSEDFCEKTLRKMEQPEPRNRLSRVLLTAVCVCLCVTLLFGTVWAASPGFRALFLRNEQIGTAERPELPGEANTVTVRELGSLTARCYKLNGEPCITEGFGGLLPVLEDGVLHYYRLTDDGLEEAFPSRRLQHRLEYDGEVYDLDLTIYDGEISTCLQDARPYYDDREDVNSVPMYDPNTLTIWRFHGDPQILSPINVNLTTWEVTDPMANLDFTPPEGTLFIVVSSFIGSRNVLINCSMADESSICCLADAVTGEITRLEVEQPGFRTGVFVNGAGVWYNPDGDLCLLGDDGQFRSVLEESEKGRFRVIRWGDYAGLFPKEKAAGDELTLINLYTAERLVLEHGAPYFSTTGSSVCCSRDRSKLALTEVGGEPNHTQNRLVALVDLTDGRLVTFERVSGLSEHMWGWLDNTHFVIVGFMDGEWYVCSYSFD